MVGQISVPPSSLFREIFGSRDGLPVLHAAPGRKTELVAGSRNTVIIQAGPLGTTGMSLENGGEELQTRRRTLGEVSQKEREKWEEGWHGALDPICTHVSSCLQVRKHVYVLMRNAQKRESLTDV